MNKQFVNSIMIPTGSSPEDTISRTEIIMHFYQEWKTANPSQRVYNKMLKDYINIRQISIEETARHASKRYLSTLAVMQLDAILSLARPVKTSKVEQRRNQQQFKAMLTMYYNCPGIGGVKLLVGIRHKTLLKG